MTGFDSLFQCNWMAFLLFAFPNFHCKIKINSNNDFRRKYSILVSSLLDCNYSSTIWCVLLRYCEVFSVHCSGWRTRICCAAACDYTSWQRFVLRVAWWWTLSTHEVLFNLWNLTWNFLLLICVQDSVRYKQNTTIRDAHE